MNTAHHDEYDDKLVDMLELIWGKGFLAPGGEETVRRIVHGLDLRDKHVVDIGSGIGGVDLVLAREFGARVTGLELEAPLIARATAYAEQAGLAGQVEFLRVESGALPFESGSIDVVFSSGVFIHVDDKAAMFRDILRVLRPGGVLSAYDWMKGPAPYSDAMRYWFELEGLTYAMDTLDNYATLLGDAGFSRIETRDDDGWYQRRCHQEYASMRGALHAAMTEVLGSDKRDHFIENWRAMTVVLDRGELRPGFLRGYKPGAAEA